MCSAADRVIDQRCALALNVARQQLMHVSLAAFKVMVRDQSFVLQLEPELAVSALASIVPEADAREELFKQVSAIVDAGGSPDAAGESGLARLPSRSLCRARSGWRRLHPAQDSPQRAVAMCRGGIEAHVNRSKVQAAA